MPLTSRQMETHLSYLKHKASYTVCRLSVDQFLLAEHFTISTHWDPLHLLICLSHTESRNPQIYKGFQKASFLSSNFCFRVWNFRMPSAGRGKKKNVFGMLNQRPELAWGVCKHRDEYISKVPKPEADNAP